MPPRFALSVRKHVLELRAKCVDVEDSPSLVSIQEAYPVGTILERVKVLRTEPERGLIVDVQPRLEGFVHVS
jgi:rRNA biogenesis protein RRP5